MCVYLCEYLNSWLYAENTNSEVVFPSDHQRFSCKHPQKSWGQAQIGVLHKFSFHGNANFQASPWNVVLQVMSFLVFIYMHFTVLLVGLLTNWLISYFAVFLHHFILRLFYTVCLNYLRRMKMVSRLCFTSRRYILVFLESFAKAPLAAWFLSPWMDNLSFSVDFFFFFWINGLVGWKYFFIIFYIWWSKYCFISLKYEIDVQLESSMVDLFYLSRAGKSIVMLFTW